MDHTVYVSFAPGDNGPARQIISELELAGFRCWHPARDISPGEEWGNALRSALEASRVVLLLESRESQRSQFVLSDILMARNQKIPIVAVALEGVPISDELSEKLGGSKVVDASAGRLREALPFIVKAVSRFVPETDRAPSPSKGLSKPSAKGYVFISYNRADLPFVQRLKRVLADRGYAYWDYSESDRNYHNALYRELEEKIERAAAFMCVLTDNWRESEWPAAEYLYAREAKVPVFILQAMPLDRPVPIILNQQTRIDFSAAFDRGSRVLEVELDKKHL